MQALARFWSFVINLPILSWAVVLAGAGIVAWIVCVCRKCLFSARFWFAYFPICVAIGLAWYFQNQEQWIIAVATGLSILLALGAIDLGWRHEKELRQVQNLIRSVFGLESYIQEASQIYKGDNIERVVTSLRHWVARGDAAKWIIEGVEESAARKIVFVGPIDWNVYYPGVLWRLVILRKILQSKNKNGTEINVLHVEDGVPAFVVSKREKNKQTNDDHGSLLIGNPMDTAGTNLYGINLEAGHPKQVDHYNFVFDTLICPDECLIKQWEVIKKCTGIEHAYEHEDGLTRIFKIKPFACGGFIYAEENLPEGDYATSLVEHKAREIAREIMPLIEVYPRKSDEKQFLPEQSEIVDWSRNFLNALLQSEILEVRSRQDPNGNPQTKAMFALKSPFTFAALPSCNEFFADKNSQHR
jgi:hypothetical protein